MSWPRRCYKSSNDLLVLFAVSLFVDPSIERKWLSLRKQNSLHLLFMFPVNGDQLLYGLESPVLPLDSFSCYLIVDLKLDFDSGVYVYLYRILS